MTTSKLKLRRVLAKMRKRRGRPDPAILAQIVEQVVRAALPESIILFGSAARCEMGPNSDYDLLVIKGGKYNYWRTYNKIYEHLRTVDAPIDVVLVTPEYAERYRDSPVWWFARRCGEGKLIYGA